MPLRAITRGPDEVRLLLVESAGPATNVYRAALEAAEGGTLRVQRVEGLSRGLAAAAQCLNDVIVVDETLEDGDGIELVRAAARWDCDAPVVVIATGRRRETFREVLAAGAVDVLVDDEVTPALLERAVRFAAERRRSQRAAQHSRRYLHALIRRSVDSILVTDARARLVYASPAYERVGGRAPDVRLGRSVFADLVPEDRRSAAAGWRALLRRPGRPLRGELRIRHADGGTRVVEVRGCNYLDDPFVRGVVLNVIDVTQWRALETELLSRQRLFRSLVEHGHDLITVVDAGGTVRFATPPVERLLGCTAQALAGSKLGERVHPDDVPEYQTMLAAAREAPGSPARAEIRLRHADGAWRIFETSATNLLHDRDVGGIVLNARDATERREAEEALRQSRERLQQVQRMEAVGRLAAGVAHDFNNILTAVHGNAELLMGELTPDGPGWEEVDEIMDATRRATVLTRQLLALGRRQVLEPRLIDLNAVVDDAGRLLRRLVEERVALDLHLLPDPAWVRADPHQLGQVLMNLVVNARDATPVGGRVTVSTHLTTVGPATLRGVPSVVSGRYVLVEVSDKGAGMDPATVEHAFEPFFSTKEPGRGTGLGLSTVYGIVKQSGGYVTIDSAPGAGTLVSVYLPLATPESGAEDVPEGEALLVVSPDAELRRTAALALAAAGRPVLGAGSAAEAVARSRQHRGTLPLLVVDADLPEISPADLASRLRAERPELRPLLLAPAATADGGAVATPEALGARAAELLGGSPPVAASGRRRPGI